MENWVNFHTQLASIIEVLANAAVAEICALVDNGFTSLRLEVSRCHRENLALRSKLRLLELRTSNRLTKTALTIPPLVVNCTRRDHIREQTSSSAEQTTASLYTVPEMESAEHPVAPPVEPEEELKEERRGEEVVVVKEEVLEEVQTAAVGLQSLAAESDLHLVTSDPSLNINTETPRILLSGCYQPDCLYNPNPKPGRPWQQEREEEERDSWSNMATPRLQSQKQRSGRGCSVGGGGTTVACQPHTGRTVGYVDACGSVSAGERGLGLGLERGSDVLQGDEAGSERSGPDRRRTDLSSLKWRRHSGGTTGIKTEGGMLSYGPEGGTLSLSLSPDPGQDNEDVTSLSSNITTNHISLSPHSNHRDGQSAESKPSQLDAAGFDSASFDELFSSPEVASSLKAPPRDPAEGGGGGEEFACLPSRGDRYRSPTPSSEPLAAATSSHLPPSQSWSRIIPTNHERPLKCRPCGRMFFSSRELLVHQRSHAGERLYHCPLCKKPFAHLHQLKTHQRVHTGEKPYSCTQCGRRFSQSSHIKRHMSVHTGERRYSCSLCGKRFSQSYSLKVHQAVHTGEKPYSCTQCGKRFSVLGNLVRHQSVHIRK